MCGADCTCSNKFYGLATVINANSQDMEGLLIAFKTKEEAEKYLSDYRNKKNEILKELLKTGKLVVNNDYFEFLLTEDFPELYLEDNSEDEYEYFYNDVDKLIAKTFFPKGFNTSCGGPASEIKIKEFSFGETILNCFDLD